MTTGKNPSSLPANLHRVAHYRIIGKLGQGGMSIVYEGLDEKLKRPVAIKILHPFLAEAEEYRARFFREAEAVARLTHPNIVQIFDVAHTDAKELYLVTELVVGETLKDFVSKINLIELPELSAMIILEILQALEHAHQKGIIHRDIKPENIMVCNNGQLKLMDFGIACIGSEENLTQTGGLLGSLNHLAPEVIKGEKISPASDLYSLSTIFYWLVTERLPFTAQTPHALLKAIVEEPVKKIQSLSPFVSDELALVIERGLEKGPKNRYESAKDMSAALEHALLALGISFESKEIQSVLKDAKNKLMPFKNALVEQIKAKQQLYQKNNDEPMALALACRLDVAKGDTENVLIKNQLSFSLKKRRKLLYFMGAFLIPASLLTFIFFLFPSKSSQDTILEKPMEEPVIYAKNDEIPVSLPIIENKPEEIIPKKKKIEPCEVEIIVWPFATISVNGKIVAKDKKSHTLKLLPGIHRFLFTHPYAATVEKTIELNENQKFYEFKVSLIKSKPAFLTVIANVNADVAVEGSYKGLSQKTLQSPVVIPIADQTHSEMKEIMVSKEGYKPYFLKTEFVAGQPRKIEVTLTPIRP